MVLTVSGIARYYSRLSPEYFVHLGCFKSNSYEEFIRELSDRKIMYVVWDNHFGYRSGSRYYNQYKAWFYGRYYNQYKAWLVSFLRDGDDKPHFKLIKRIKVQSREALIYKFNPLN